METGFIRYRLEHIKEVVSIGSASFFRSFFGVFAAIMINRAAGSYSTSALAGISVATRVMMFPFGIVLGFGQGYQPVVGYNWGAQRYDRVKESYEFAVNRSRNGNTAAIETLNADYTGVALEATATYSVQGNIMQIAVPRAALGLDEGGDFYFKVADGVADPAEIMDYYATGRSLPMGRLSYLYQMDE
jgi:hypothetical protein